MTGGSEIDLRRMERDPTDEFSLAPSKRESDRFSHARTVSAESVTGSYSMAYHVHPPSPEIQGHSPL